jgi:acetoin utilization deacetylase AcuC-like enzyme
MRVVLVTHDVSMEHDTGRGHPERPARIPAVVEGVRGAGHQVVDLAAPVATSSSLELVHDASYITAIERFCASGGGSIDPDTVARPASWEAALRSAGAGPAAVAALVAGEGDIGFVVMRPPGHHALRARAMGFCFFNNVAVTARTLVAAGERVAIVDWDVHHGNGTQDVFYDDPSVLYISLHEFPAYPGTGWYTEVGAGAGAGTTINFPWPYGTDGAAYRWAIDEVVRPVLVQFAPTWLLVSAGYDAHVDDPLAGIRLVADDYRYMSARLASVVAPQRTVVFLEGGYDLDALRESAAATISGWAAEDPGPQDVDLGETTVGELAEAVAAETSRHWDI